MMTSTSIVDSRRIFTAAFFCMTLLGSPELLASEQLLPQVRAPSIQELSQSKAWHRLLHYDRSFPFFKMKTRADGQGFFFAPQGATDPARELTATIKAFSENIKVGHPAQHPQCAFPARYQFIKNTLGLAIADVPCPELQEFLLSFNALSATLVFSSAYPNNPASMFGHTFLRINSKSGNKLDILDRGVSYAAAIGDENGFVFAFNGLTGRYKGFFSVLPYYVKVNEYNNAESRDIWEYDLALNENETNLLLKHLWEIESNTYFDYFFFDENCSTILLALLEVVKPQWNLLNFFLYAIPGETIKKVAGIDGAVTGVKFRPSLRKKMVYRFKNLDSKSRKDFFEVLSGGRSLNQIHDPALVEAVTTFLAYEKQEKQDKFSETHKLLLEGSLLRRSELGPSANDKASKQGFEPPTNSRPDLAHNPLRLGTSAGLQKQLYFHEIQVKLMVHDFLNNDDGYIPFSHVEFPGITMRYRPKDSKFNIESIDFLSIKSLFPLTFLEKKPSWAFHLRHQIAHDLQNCDDCHVFHGEFGGGATAELFSEKAIASAMAMLDADIGDSLRKGFRFGPRLQLSTLLNPLPRYKTVLAANFVSDLFQRDRQKVFYFLEWGHAVSLSRYWDVRMSYQQFLGGASIKNIYNESKFTINFFF